MSCRPHEPHIMSGVWSSDVVKYVNKYIVNGTTFIRKTVWHYNYMSQSDIPFLKISVYQLVTHAVIL